MTKKFLSMLLAAAMCLSLAVVAIATDAPDTDIRKSDGIFISAACSENIDFKNQIWGQTVATYNGTANQAEVFVSTDKSFAHVNLTYHGTLYSAVLPGQYTGIALSETMGYVGVYEGFLVPVEGEGGPSIPVIADITFTSEEMFTILTLGYFDDPENFNTLYFGPRSEKIEEISCIYAEKVIARQGEEAQSVEVNDNNLVNPASINVNGDIEFWGRTSRELEGYIVSRLSLFHAPELGNQHSTPILVKINSDCNGAKSAILKQGITPGYTFLTVYPDTLYFSINGRSNKFHVEENNYSPEEGKTSFNIKIPFYTDLLGLQTFDANLSMSKNTVTKLPVGTGYLDDSIISWEIWKRLGWQTPSLDGDWKEKSGYAVRAYYRYDGNVSEPQIETFSVTGSLRYEYVLMMGSGTTNQHIRTSNMLINSSIKIMP